MNQREQFEKETGLGIEVRATKAYLFRYIEWLEQRNKELVYSLEQCVDSFGRVLSRKTVRNADEVVLYAKQQLKKNGAL